MSKKGVSIKRYWESVQRKVFLLKDTGKVSKKSISIKSYWESVGANSRNNKVAALLLVKPCWHSVLLKLLIGRGVKKFFLFKTHFVKVPTALAYQKLQISSTRIFGGLSEPELLAGNPWFTIFKQLRFDPCDSLNLQFIRDLIYLVANVTVLLI